MGEKRIWYIPIIIILIVFLLLTIALIGRDLFLASGSSQQELQLLEQEAFSEQETVQENISHQGKECLYIWDSRDANSQLFHEQMPRILQDMQVEFSEYDTATQESADLGQYDTVVLGLTDYQGNSGQLLEVMDWTEAGGNLLVAQVPAAGSMYDWMAGKMGVESTGVTYYEVSAFRVSEELMLTGNQNTFQVSSPYESAIAVNVTDDCKVYMVTDDDREVPLLWEKEVGKGQVVVVNLGRYEKFCRGIYSAAYSLLEDVCVWPVINSSAFYLDGVPFPLPSGKNEYISVQYDENMDVYTFYVREWINDLMEFSRSYGIPLTGSLQENNDGDVDPPYQSHASDNRYEYFISLLLDTGGEVGLYGYNQQPLCISQDRLEPSDPEVYENGYEEDMGLEYWDTMENMENSLREVISFQKGIDEEEEMTVYTPPYGIYSDSGITALKNAAPQIRAVAGLYQESGYAPGQEFEVDADGLVMTPRITTGSYVVEEDRLYALSELNLHYVNTHMISPQDVLNPDAGAEEGWDAMLGTLEAYEDWLESAAPNLRRHSGSELAAAVQRYSYLDVKETVTESELKLELGNFQDEAWIMLRFNEWKPDTEQGVKGGTLEKLTDDLYLLEASQEQVTIQKKVEG